MNQNHTWYRYLLFVPLIVIISFIAQLFLIDQKQIMTICSEGTSYCHCVGPCVGRCPMEWAQGDCAGYGSTFLDRTVFALVKASLFWLTLLGAFLLAIIGLRFSKGRLAYQLATSLIISCVIILLIYSARLELS